MNSKHFQNRDKIPVLHHNNNSNPRSYSEVKKGSHVVQGQKPTVQALRRLIQVRLNGSLVPTSKDRVTYRFPFCWKRKILHERDRLIAMKSVSPLLFTQGPCRYYGIKIGTQSVHFPPFGWKIKILHVRARLMDTKSVSPFVFFSSHV